MTEWRRVRLKHLSAVPITTGVGLPAEHQNPDWPRYIRTTDISGPHSLRDDVFYSQPPQLLETAGVRRGDLLMTSAGTVGQSYLHLSDEPAVFAGYLARFRPGPAVDHRFIAYWAQSSGYWQQIETRAVRSTIDNFSAGRYQNMELVVPSLDLQARVADFLDRETQRIDETVRRIEAVQILTQNRLEAAISEALEPWIETVPLKRLIDSRRPLTYGIVQAGENHAGGVPYIRPVDMVGHTGVPDADSLLRTSPEIADSYRRSILRRGDLVVSIGPSFGKTMIVPPELEGANLTQGTARVAPSRGSSARFLQWVLRSAAARAHWEASVGGATFSALNLEPLGRTPVPLVPHSAQSQIADLLDGEEASMVAASATLERLKALLAERRLAVITAAVTGELDVEAMV